VNSCNFSGEVKSCAIGPAGARLQSATGATEKLESWKIATIHLSPSMKSCMIRKDLGHFGKLDDNFSPPLNSCNFSLQPQLFRFAGFEAQGATFQLSNFSLSLACRFVKGRKPIHKSEAEAKAFQGRSCQADSRGNRFSDRNRVQCVKFDTSARFFRHLGDFVTSSRSASKSGSSQLRKMGRNRAETGLGTTNGSEVLETPQGDHGVLRGCYGVPRLEKKRPPG
jgi:hypothetical protein